MCSIRDVNFWKEFFDMYKHYPELWKIKSEAYKNRMLKRRAYAQLLEKYREFEPDANEDTLKRRINSIRGCYRRELKKVNKSYESGCGAEDVYQPSLWYYPHLNFLKEQEEETEDGITSLEIESNYMDSETHDNSEYQEDPVAIGVKTSTPKAYAKTKSITPANQHFVQRSKRLNSETHDSSDDQEDTAVGDTKTSVAKPYAKTNFITPAHHHSLSRSKRLATEKALEDLKLICKALNQPPEEQNEFDCFGASVACQLKKLPEKVAQESMDYIQSFLVRQRVSSIDNPCFEVTFNKKRMRSECLPFEDEEKRIKIEISQMTKRMKEKEMEFMETEHNKKVHILNLEMTNLENRLKYDEEEHILKVQELSTFQK